ncbi:MAG: T9SS type A sorting domain-containing protein [Candidatus Delongbacteria bacterium]|jgi:hypothetical protein
MKQKLILIPLLLITLLIPIHAQTGWSAPLQLSRNGVWPSLMIGFPAVTVDNNGVIYAFWAISLEIDGDWSNGWYSQIEYRKSTDGGLTWTATQNITPEYTDQRIYAIEAVCDSQNNVHLVYMRGSENCKVIYKNFNGSAWTEPYEVYPYSTVNLRLCIDSADRIYAAWVLGEYIYYTFLDQENEPTAWLPAIILDNNKYGIDNLCIGIDNNLCGIGSSIIWETDLGISYRPFMFKYTKSLESWTKIEKIGNYNEKCLGGAISLSKSDSVYANVAVGPSICVNTDNHLIKSNQDTLWSEPNLFGDNNAWDREMFIDKNGSLHLFELHFYEGDISGDMGQIHSEYKNGVWAVESIDSLHNFSYSEPNVTFDKANGKCYLTYAKSDRLRSITRIFFQSKQITTGINDPDENIPESHMLFQNYPNPFNNSTEISYSINYPANFKLNIFNIKGEFVQSLVNKKQNKGQHSVIFSADNLNSGIYYYQLEVDGAVKETKKMLYLK